MLEIVLRGTAHGDVWWAGIAGGFFERGHRRLREHGRIHRTLTAGCPLGRQRFSATRRPGLPCGQQRRQGDAGVRALHANDLLGGARGHDPATAAAPLGPQVDDVIGPLHDV